MGHKFYDSLKDYNDEIRFVTRFYNVAANVEQRDSFSLQMAETTIKTIGNLY